MRFFYLFCLLVLSACASGPDNPQSYLATKRVSNFTDYRNFQHCRGYGCREVDTLTLQPHDWKEIAGLFKQSPANAEQERERIAEAVGLLETKVGAMNRTDQDVYGTFKKVGAYQHDCVDESTNTTIYIALLAQEGLLTFHETGKPDTRIPLVHYRGTWPHQTAVIFEKESGKAYAVDSWFHSNGHPAEIVPLETWKSGWRPAEIKK